MATSVRNVAFQAVPTELPRSLLVRPHRRFLIGRSVLAAWSAPLP
jgi:hypothetical protein